MKNDNNRFQSEYTTKLLCTDADTVATLNSLHWTVCNYSDAEECFSCVKTIDDTRKASLYVKPGSKSTEYKVCFPHTATSLNQLHPTKNIYHFLYADHACYSSSPSHTSQYIHANSIRWNCPLISSSSDTLCVAIRTSFKILGHG